MDDFDIQSDAADRAAAVVPADGVISPI